MSSDRVPAEIKTIDKQHEPLRSVLKKREKDYAEQYDCTSCRVMGASAFIGLGAYSYWSGHRQLKLREREILKSGRSSISGKKGSAFGRLMMRIYEVSGNKKDSSMEA
ncbi:hypothetical protein M8818_000746 [Zalaria obscura]|uniref:Uncharacterized protein n=1 Tax=Zalaria obscura TaxID=2024903 RepID=A0ACC3SMR5_9PEZI